MSEQTPSPGRIVRYTDHNRKDHPAVITEVNADGSVALAVLHTTNPQVQNKTDDSQAANTWHWPPYVPPAK